MQSYEPKTVATEAEYRENNSTAGAKRAVYYLKPNGFKFSRNGAEFTEVVLLKDNGQKVELVCAKLPTGDGEFSWDTMSMKNWANFARNTDAILGFIKQYGETAKQRIEQSANACKEQAKTLKVANLSSVEIQAILKSRGYLPTHVEEAMKELA